MDQRLYRRGVTLWNLLHSVFLCGDLVMGRVKSWMEDLKESAMVDCADCNGDGKVEVALAADHFRNDDCETCRGTGQVEGEDEYD